MTADKWIFVSGNVKSGARMSSGCSEEFLLLYMIIRIHYII